MRTLFILFAIFTSINASLAAADEPSALIESKIDIIAPAEGAILYTKNSNALVYNVTLAGDDDHILVYLDDQKLQKLRQMQGSYTFEKLPLGDHVFCIKIAYKDHTLTGLQRCVKVKIFNNSRW
jgi:hypothetical protein